MSSPQIPASLGATAGLQKHGGTSSSSSPPFPLGRSAAGTDTSGHSALGGKSKIGQNIKERASHPWGCVRNASIPATSLGTDQHSSRGTVAPVRPSAAPPLPHTHRRCSCPTAAARPHQRSRDLAQPRPSTPHCTGSSILKQALCCQISPRAGGHHPKSFPQGRSGQHQLPQEKALEPRVTGERSFSQPQPSHSPLPKVQGASKSRRPWEGQARCRWTGSRGSGILISPLQPRGPCPGCGCVTVPGTGRSQPTSGPSCQQP